VASGFGGLFMRTAVLTAAFLAAALTAHSSANAATLSMTVTADNAFAVYLSTSDSARGDLIGSNLGGVDGQWKQSFALPDKTLTDPNYFIHVIGTNYNQANGLFPDPGTPNGTAPNPDAFLGQFSITGGGYQFANNTTSLFTNSTDWKGIGALNNTTWTQPTDSVQNFGLNGGSNIWAGALGGPVPGISDQAFWIWSNPDNTNYADFSTAIFATDAPPPSETPLPAALPLFVGGLGAMGLLGWRRKMKAASNAAA
jgi:hypothetical protein